MTNLANQLRAALFLASRSAYVKGAFVLPALLMAWMVAVLFLSDGTAWTTYELAFSGLLSVGPIFGTSFATLGLVAHDRDSGGLRASAGSEGGRTGYVASRVLLAGVLAAALTLWSAALSLVALALPGVSVDGTPAETLALLALVRFLVGWAYAVICVALTSAAHGMGATFLVALLVTQGALYSLAQMIGTIAWHFLFPVVTSDWFEILSSCSLQGLIQSFAAGDPVRFLALPLVYLALAAALFHARTARRSL